MKKCLLFTIFLLKLAYNVHGNTVSYHEVNSAKTDSVKLIRDSTQYLRDSIIANKEKFLHKAMNTLLKELRISAKSYIVILGYKPLGTCEGIYLYFDNIVVVANNHDKILPNLIITFDADISHRTAMLLFLKNLGQWDDGALAQYGPMLIKDITQIH